MPAATTKTPAPRVLWKGAISFDEPAPSKACKPAVKRTARERASARKAATRRKAA
ncbi:hypothetical protein [Variovorax sp. RA8]|jgi:hypothetical protein|uniref:hypothetical protein n=1 Tax=Variovorax sp. (strain JCM 16519 / RA8) TaxID=662548 RepID=UPI0013171F35|nr:hypothetical protein [Variovorax sp. RA8]VTU37198.1 hypothetical protein RA8CHR_05662 [Variovorax sp. RA8]